MTAIYSTQSSSCAALPAGAGGSISAGPSLHSDAATLAPALASQAVPGAGHLVPPSQAVACPALAGRTFWLNRKRFVGSYLALSAARRA